MKEFELSDFIKSQEEYNESANLLIDLFKNEVKTKRLNGLDEEDLEKFYNVFIDEIDDINLVDYLYEIMKGE